MHWRIQSFPELENLADDERRALLREALPGWSEYSMIGRAVIYGFATAGLACTCLAPLSATFIAGTFVSGWMLVTLTIYRYMLIQTRGRLLMYLERLERRKRLPMCLKCGYPTQGLAGERCPECGRRLD